MRQGKKLAAVLLSLMMIATMSVGAFAAGSGTITVDNPIIGQTYTAYKIFDVVYDTEPDGSAGDHYAYTINSDSKWLSTVKTYAGASGSGMKLELITGTCYAVVTDGTFSASAFAKALKAKVTGDTQDAEIAATGKALTDNASGGKQVSGLELGYYFVTSSSGALCNLTTTNPTVTIHDKNDVPFEKTDNKDSVEIGETVNYTITGKVPDTTGFEEYQYIIKDSMSDGLSLQNNVAVTIGGADVTGSCTLSYNTNPTGFELTIPVKEYQAQVGAAISVSYSAVVNENAIATVEKNKATLTYSNDPTDENKTITTPPQEETVYSAGIVVDKYEANPADDEDYSTKLAGAKFMLYKEDAGGTKAYYHYHDKVGWFTLAQIVEKLNEKNRGTAGWTALPTDAGLEDVLALGEAVYGEYLTCKTTDSNGAAEFVGLSDGTYFLLETAAPKGYNPLREAVKVTVNGSEATETNVTPRKYTARVANNTGAELPSTGGMGTTVFYAVGTALLVGAAVLLIVKRRTGKEK